MTVLAIEQSTEDSEPVDLYRISIGTQVFYLTSHSVDVTFNGQLYVATPISRTSPRVTAESTESSVDTTLPQSHALAQLYYNLPPGQKGKILIRRTHKSLLLGTSYDFAFYGYLSNVKFTGDVSATFRWDNPMSFFNQNGPRYMYTTLCNNVLGDLRCGVDMEAKKFVGTVSLVNDDAITVPGASGKGADYFDGGFAQFLSPQGLDYRLILQQTGDVLRLLAPFRDNVLGASITLHVGCKHRAVQDCQTKFNNLLNFGGYPHIPPKNPFETRIL